MRWVGSLVILSVAVTAGAGELVLKNGSHIAGDLSNEAIMVSTGSDLIEIAPDQVALLTPDEIRLRDGRVIRGTLIGGHLKARTALGELTVTVDELQEFRGDLVATAPAAPTPSVAMPAAGATPPTPPPTATAQETRPTPPPRSPQAAADGSTGPTQVVQGAGKIGQGVKETATGVGQAVVEGADRVHDGAKSIGLSIWDAMRAVGRTFQMVFGDAS